MNLKHVAHSLVGLWVFLQDPQSRNERGLSQSVEIALLVAGAAAVGIAIVAAIQAYVIPRVTNLPG